MVNSGVNASNMRSAEARTKRSGSRHNRQAALALSWLALDETGASLMSMARNLLQAQEVVRKALPPVLGQGCRVANIDRQRITLAVPGAAHATRLRQLTPTLLRALVQHGWNLTEVEIRVQAAMTPKAPPRPPREVRPLDRQALVCFKSLEQTVPPGPLADAIARLLKHHGVGK